MNPDSSKYSKFRLILGMSYVGLTVLIVVILLSRGIPATFAFAGEVPFYITFKNILICVICFELIGLPFDLAGHLIDKHFGKTSSNLTGYLIKWAHCTLKHGMFFAGISLMALFALRVADVFGLVVFTVLFSIILLWKQAEAARFLSGISFEEPPQELRAHFPQNRKDTIPIVTAITDEKNFTGGIVGLPGRETHVIPEDWINNFSNQELWVELTRRNHIIKSGSRKRGLLTAIAFTTIGIIISALISKMTIPNLDSFAGLLSISLYFTLWSFGGLLLLPASNHKGVYEADRRTLQTVLKKDLLVNAIKKVDCYLEGDYVRNKTRELIFHPIPSLSWRIAHLESKDSSQTGAWNCARYTIFLSIVGLGLLGKAVHCNAGRPDLWALLPCD